MSMILTAAAVTVGGNLLAGKIASNRQNDPKAAIGSGTAPVYNLELIFKLLLLRVVLFKILVISMLKT